MSLQQLMLMYDRLVIIKIKLSNLGFKKVLSAFNSFDN